MSRLPLSAEAAVAAYDELAPHYDRRWRRYLETSLGVVVAQLPVWTDTRLLDVGCGTGLLLAQLATGHGRLSLAGVDPSPEMLARARERVGEAAELHQGAAENLPFADGAFDAVTCCNAFHYFPDPDRALCEMFRVLRPGGLCVLTDWRRNAWWFPLIQIGLRVACHPVARVETTEGLRKGFEETGFEVSHVRHYRAGTWWPMVLIEATARIRAQL